MAVLNYNQILMTNNAATIARHGNYPNQFLLDRLSIPRRDGDEACKDLLRLRENEVSRAAANANVVRLETVEALMFDSDIYRRFGDTENDITLAIECILGRPGLYTRDPAAVRLARNAVAKQYPILETGSILLSRALYFRDDASQDRIIQTFLEKIRTICAPLVLLYPDVPTYLELAQALGRFSLSDRMIARVGEQIVEFEAYATAADILRRANEYLRIK